MQYLALYRKFRPRALSEVVRQEHIVKTLISQIESGRISHAYLFCGPRGTGKTSVAKIFAASINCEKDKSGQPCGACPSCLALADPSNLDITEIDAASNNRVDEVRELREKVQYPPVSVKYKVYIIDEVHMLTDQAFNALLKTLEEPPSHAVFILATTEVHKLPATILSRCMRFDFKLIPQTDIAKHIADVLKKSGRQFEEAAANEIARAGGGSVRDALSVAEVCLSYGTGKLTYKDVIEVLGGADFESLSALGKSIVSGDAGGALQVIDDLIKSGKSAAVLIRDISDFLRAVLICLTCKDSKNILSMPEEYYVKVKELSVGADINGLIRGLEVLAKAESQMRYASSPKIILETAAVKITQPETDYNLDALLSRVSALEKQLGSKMTVFEKAVDTAAAEKPAVFDKEPLPEIEIPEAAALDDLPLDMPEIQAEQTIMEDIAAADATADKKTEQTEPLAAFDKEKLWGQFNILLRKSGEFVLRTVINGLNAEYDGEKLIIFSDTPQKYSVLTKADNSARIKKYLQSLGCADFEVRNIIEGEDLDLKSIKSTFPNIKITVEQEE